MDRTEPLLPVTRRGLLLGAAATALAGILKPFAPILPARRADPKPPPLPPELFPMRRRGVEVVDWQWDIWVEELDRDLCLGGGENIVIHRSPEWKVWVKLAVHPLATNHVGEWANSNLSKVGRVRAMWRPNVEVSGLAYLSSLSCDYPGPEFDEWGNPIPVPFELTFRGIEPSMQTTEYFPPRARPIVDETPAPFGVAWLYELPRLPRRASPAAL